MPIRAELQARLKHSGHLMKSGLPPLWGTTAAVVVLIGGSVAAGVTWGFRHWLIGVAVVLGLLAFVIAEGSYRVFRQTNKDHAREIAAERAMHKAQLDAAPPSDISPRRKAAILAAARADAQVQDLEALRARLEEGRVVQASLGRLGARNFVLPSDQAVEVAQWEAKASTALTHTPHFHAEFRAVPREAVFDATTGSAYDRMERQLEVLEAAIQDLERLGSRDGL